MKCFLFYYCAYCAIVGFAFAHKPRMAEINSKTVGMLPIINANIMLVASSPKDIVAYKPQAKGTKYNNAEINMRIPPTLALTK